MFCHLILQCHHNFGTNPTHFWVMSTFSTPKIDLKEQILLFPNFQQLSPSRIPLFPIMRDEMAFLDQYVAPGLRLWMLVGLVSAVLLVMIVIVCCFVRLRIPRTKRQIELRAAKRRKRKAEKTGTDFGEPHEQDPYRGGQTIVLNSFNNSGPNRPNNGGRRTTSDLAGGPNAPISRSIPV